ncbi:MAG TPA: SDR family oxidoreductase [Alphaproteobacteria bacterium]|nr:SDR family oxidoreductase [Alphaproteobacteria bacterium]
MDLKLDGRRALVTGSTAGIGLATARELALLGATVAINGRGEARVRQAIATLERDLRGRRFVPAPGDVGTAKGVAEVLKAVPDADILVNNAGIYEPKPFVEISDEEWLRYFEVNVLSGVRLARALAPGMASRRWGRIVFISSESGLQIPSEMVHYGMTKTAQLAVSRGLAESLAGTGVTVNSVLPGPTLSEGVAEFVKQMSTGDGPVDLEAVGTAFVKKVRPTSLIGRFASVEEVANMVAYICTPAASATTGSSLRVDGGVVRTIA